MAIIANLPENYNTLSSVSFRLQIEKLPHVTYFLQTANLPGITVAESTVATPTRAYPVTGTIIEFETLDITFIIDEDMKNFMEIFQWLRAMSSTEDLAQERAKLQSIFGNSSLYSDATLTILSNKNNPIVEVRFSNMYPVSLGALEFNQQATDVEYMTVSAEFTYQIYEIHAL